MTEHAFFFPDDLSLVQPRWSNPEHTMIECSVHIPHLGPGLQRYNAAKVDPGWPHSEKMFDILANGDLGIPIAEYEPPPGESGA